MRILVTGASGFVGRHLVPALMGEGHEVACLVRYPNKLPANWADLPQGQAEPTGQGVRALCASFRPQVVVHLAALYVTEHRYEDIAPLIEANLLLGAHLLEAMHECRCNAMVWAGTSWQHYQGADYRPVNLYAATKQAFSALAEYYLDAAGLRLLELHLYDSYGEDDPRNKLINLLKNSARTAEIMVMSPGEQRMHLVHVDDVAKGFALACKQVLEHGSGERRVYRLPAERVVDLRELVELFNQGNPDCPVQVTWGVRSYRMREVFQPWEAADILPDWRPAIDLPTGLRRLHTYRCQSPQS